MSDTWTNSTYLNYDSYNTKGTAGQLESTTFSSSFAFNVGLVLERAGEDPTAPGGLLTLDWAHRQAKLKELTDSGALWTTYGADQQTYEDVKSALSTLGISLTDPKAYISTQDSRTIWVQVDQSNIMTLLGADFGISRDEQGTYHLTWDGALALNPAIPPGVKGLVFDATTAGTLTINGTSHDVNIGGPIMPATPPSGTIGKVLAEKAQSQGNSAFHYDSHGDVVSDFSELFPQEIAALYNFPLTTLPDGVTSPLVGLIEPGLGNASPSRIADLSRQLNDYLRQAGLVDPHVTVHGVQEGGTGDPDNGERALDIAVMGAAMPWSDQVLYAGSGYDAHAQSTAFTAYQSAIFDPTYIPQIITSSWGMGANYPAPGSAFAWAFQQMFIDAALANKTMLVANGDVGSGRTVASGVANTALAEDSPYNLMVSGTSISAISAAMHDTTLATTWENRHDPLTVWQLVQGGLTMFPAVVDPKQWFEETVWNEYYVTGNSFTNVYGKPADYLMNNAGSGGIDSAQPIPSYQEAYGLTQDGRGLPDVAALAGGSMVYKVPQGDMTTSPYSLEEGTSAATPLWAALIAQIDTVFHDQGLPNLGYMNDLLYIASAVGPASFNDVTVGNNNSSFYNGAGTNHYSTGSGEITPTRLGYEAGTGYDFASGLGSPNGLVLARTLSAIANTQTNDMTSHLSHGVIDLASGNSNAAQTLLVQNNFRSDVAGAAKHVQVRGHDPVDMGDNSMLGWTSRLAGQAVQGAIFDSALMPLLDGGAKSIPHEIRVQAGDTLGVSVDGQALALYQELLTNDYGFIQFGDADGGITLARPVATAETALGANDQTAIVRIRQNGGDATQLEIYKVDDYNGTVAGLSPDEAGYGEAALSAAYKLVGGGTVIAGPGQGNFSQVEITGVDAGDLLAFRYFDVTTNDAYFSFSQANNGRGAALFNYGLNTWGFEDRPLTGDHDFQDLVVQLDFTSTAGHGLLVT